MLNSYFHNQWSFVYNWLLTDDWFIYDITDSHRLCVIWNGMLITLLWPGHPSGLMQRDQCWPLGPCTSAKTLLCISCAHNTLSLLQNHFINSWNLVVLQPPHGTHSSTVAISQHIQSQILYIVRDWNILCNNISDRMTANPDKYIRKCRPRQRFPHKQSRRLLAEHYKVTTTESWQNTANISVWR